MHAPKLLGHSTSARMMAEEDVYGLFEEGLS